MKGSSSSSSSNDRQSSHQSHQMILPIAVLVAAATAASVATASFSYYCFKRRTNALERQIKALQVVVGNRSSNSTGSSRSSTTPTSATPTSATPTTSAHGVASAHGATSATTSTSTTTSPSPTPAPPSSISSSPSRLDDQSFTLHEIGRLETPFPQRAGCPRQGGALCCHVQSRLLLKEGLPMALVDGLLEYSHVWIVFQFHLNARGKAKQSSNKQQQQQQQQQSSSSSQVNKTFSSSKIRPPRAPGKVGVLSTRAPHRPNPIGLSVGYLERIEMVQVARTSGSGSGSGGSSKRVCLTIRGLDLVDDTPVYDIKPYMPTDRIAYFEQESSVESSVVASSSAANAAVTATFPTTSATTSAPAPAPTPGDGIPLSVRMNHVRVPEWVMPTQQQFQQVHWTDDATQSLQRHVHELAPLYTSATIQEAQAAITEIVLQDPRGLQDGRGSTSRNTSRSTSRNTSTSRRSSSGTSNGVGSGGISNSGGGSPTNKSSSSTHHQDECNERNPFDISFQTLRISFCVTTSSSSSPDNEDDNDNDNDNTTTHSSATITKVQVDPGDLMATAPGSYPHNLGLRRQAEQHQQQQHQQAGKPRRRLNWCHRVREGDMGDDLWELKGGGRYHDMDSIV